MFNVAIIGASGYTGGELPDNRSSPAEYRCFGIA